MYRELFYYERKETIIREKRLNWRTGLSSGNSALEKLVDLKSTNWKAAILLPQFREQPSERK